MYDCKTVTQVSRECSVSPRMLRYYEKLGLIESKRKEDYSYRIYDAETVGRIKMILLLRKLRVSLKDIEAILKDKKQEQVLKILQSNIAELDEEIEAMDTIRKVLTMIVARYREEQYTLLADSELVEMIDSLAPAKKQIQEAMTMNDVNKSNEVLNKNLNVRVLMLSSYTVASCRTQGENPEEAVGDKVTEFIQSSHLFEKKPDARMFGFNSPNPGVLPNGEHGYEVYVTIPEDMVLPEGFEKKQMEGGLYAALTIKFPEFHLWEDLIKWAENHEKYEPDWKAGPEVMHGMLEEHLNWVYAAHMGWPENGIDGQIDLLLPIKTRR
ncbi:MAG: effector binding domain-containing protein [bacterium]|nr:effector binding domain-containing protein [bacterium]